MDWFKILKYIYKHIVDLDRNFFWKDYIHNNKNRLYTLAWDKICRPKSEGGLGIRRIEDVNATFLAKQGWKILT